MALYCPWTRWLTCREKALLAMGGKLYIAVPQDDKNICWLRGRGRKTARGLISCHLRLLCTEGGRDSVGGDHHEMFPRSLLSALLNKVYELVRLFLFFIFLHLFVCCGYTTPENNFWWSALLLPCGIRGLNSQT